ncbi:MAG TPA: NAD(P)H-dependent oxidoreductase [Rhodanobacteraceae bacterium]|nr:NAD(P)H-dependent oxidoreductase [Rhodanobacteraceae bacterium]
MTDDAQRPLPRIRKGQGPDKLDRAEFERRLRLRYFDPVFERDEHPVARVVADAWDGYVESRKSPRTRKAGPGFADPDYELSVEWLDARAAIDAAAKQHADASRARRILVVCGSPRNDKTCPGEMSKTFRLATLARDVLTAAGAECDFLDLSHLTSEFGRVIHPCKACVSTAMPLCHWPCSCYPNHSLGQSNDWMNEIYPRWVAAHGILIVTPVHWFQVPSVLKLMLDRLVCADGGNPDPSTTHGKNVEEAKRLELDGWPYPRHLAGRAFAVVAHGDTDGAETVRRALVDWLSAMDLVQAGAAAAVDRFIGYYEPYATSHEALDRDAALFDEVRNAATSLVREVELMRAGRIEPDDGLRAPRDK